MNSFCSNSVIWCYILFRHLFEHSLEKKCWHEPLLTRSSFVDVKTCKLTFEKSEEVSRMCSVKRLWFKILQKSQKAPVSDSTFQQNCWPEACNFIRKETLAQVFFCEFFKIFNNNSGCSGCCFWNIINAFMRGDNESHFQQKNYQRAHT